jgi:glyoxylase-like metal-dependent hydrolase (beta-lactamase superfamily II)
VRTTPRAYGGVAVCHDAGVSSRVHHLNCATFHPPIGRWRSVMPSRLVAHCLLVEGDQGLTLVDTGLGSDDIADPRRLGSGLAHGLGPDLDPSETAASQVAALGYDVEDVRDVVLTHLDLDHAGGLGDFPKAAVHVHADELAAARRRRHPREKGRYLPAQWAHGPRWTEHDVDGEDWFGFGSVRVIGDGVLLVPLLGHTRGHCAVAVRRPSGGWFLHCGDAYFFHGEMSRPPECPVGLRAFQTAVQMDKAARLANQARLRELRRAHPDDVTLFSAHDAAELDALAHVTD